MTAAGTRDPNGTLTPMSQEGPGRLTVRRRRLSALVAVLAIATASCGGPESAASETSGPATSTGSDACTYDGVAHEDMGDMGGMDHAADDVDASTTTTTVGDDKGLGALLALQMDHGVDTPEQKLCAKDQKRLNQQLEGTRAVITKYPTVAAAEADGYERAGPFTPGLGIHFYKDLPQNEDGVIDDEDLAYPILIFDGMHPQDPIVGLMYIYNGDGDPEGFAGPNDHWHKHPNVCIIQHPDGTVDAPFGSDTPGITEAVCASRGGQILPSTGAMVHVWTVPGWENPNGTFQTVNPAITCPDGTYYMIQPTELDERESFCRP